MLCMETIIKVRRLYFKENWPKSRIARHCNLSRNTVAKYINQPTQIIPPKYERLNQHYPQLGLFIDRLNSRLQSEILLPVEQRHTAVRHYEYLKELGFTGSYSSVSRFINHFNQTHQINTPKVFIKQKYAPAEAYQFDWSIEKVNIAGEIIKINVAHFRLCHSRAFFIKAYPTQKMEMLIDAHNEAFSFFGGVPNRGIYDNMKTAVTAIGTGKERVFNPQFLCLMNHFLIEPVACTPAAGWEKGQVERQVRTLRQRIFQPMLSVNSLTELNQLLKTECLKLMDSMKHPEWKEQTIMGCWEQERPLLSHYQPYLGHRLEVMSVNNQSLIKVDGSQYSVPVQYAGQSINVMVTAQQIRCSYHNEIIAEHQRSFIKGHITYEPLHYLKLLERKPGALRNGEPFIDMQLPKVIQQLQAHLIKKIGGDKVLVKLFSMMADYELELALTAAELALEQGIVTPEVVLNIINRLREPLPPKLQVADIPLSLPLHVNCKQYDQVLSEVY